jgi:hypothetical protein
VTNLLAQVDDYLNVGVNTISIINADSFCGRRIFARPSPNKTLGASRRHFLSQGSRTPVECQAISFSTIRKRRRPINAS